MSDWLQTLSRLGARLHDGAVADFGAPAAELAAARDSAVVCDLAPWGVLAVGGPDARAFLQGQLSNDVHALAVGDLQLTAFCSPKGRMLAALALARTGQESYLGLLPAALAEPVRKRLSMYVLRAKVAVTDESARWIRLGLGGPAARSAHGADAPPVPSPGRVEAAGSGWALGHPDGRVVFLVAPAEAEATWRRLAARATPAGYPAWEWLGIRAGTAEVVPQTQDAFVPQMANWDLVGGVSFRKGCYTGQEIVARMHYLGRLKERMFRLYAAAGTPQPVPGTRLFGAAFGEQPCATVVAAAPSPDGGVEMLAVAQRAAIAQGPLRLGSVEGPEVASLPLPYALPDADALSGRP
jgi:folate-binding protein YgfZ